MPPKRITLLATWADTVTMATKEHMDSGYKEHFSRPKLNYHLLGEQKIPGFLRRLYALISVHRESLQSQRIQCRPRHL